MTDAVLHQAHQWSRCSLPVLTVVLAMMLDLLPLPNASPHAVSPLLGLAAVYFWTLYRPDLLPPLALFVLGLVFDLAAGLPLGMTAMLFLVVCRLVLAPHRSLLAGSFGVMWAGCMLVAAVVAVLRWLLAMAWWGHVFPFRPVLFEAALTVALYPLIAWLLGRLQPVLPRASHAPRG